jgi:GntR family transcriptional regulator, transcriptional repressor for pyruvate dehydrogenase complex
LDQFASNGLDTRPAQNSEICDESQREQRDSRQVSNVIRTQKIAEAMAEHIEKLILEGVLRPGEKLASERELAEKLEISRPSLREALELLVQRGLLVSGRSGTKVAQFLSPLIKPLATLMQDNPRVTADYFEFRRIQETHAARFAALRATDVDRQAIRQCIERMTKAHALEDPTQEGDADVELHLLIYEAAHNVVLLHLMRALANLLRNNIFYNRSQLYQREGVRVHLLEQHLALSKAVIAGEAKDAEAAAAEHIRFTFEMVEEIRRDNLRLETSLSRVNRSDFLAG